MYMQMEPLILFPSQSHKMFLEVTRVCRIQYHVKATLHFEEYF